MAQAVQRGLHGNINVRYISANTSTADVDVSILALQAADKHHPPAAYRVLQRRHEHGGIETYEQWIHVLLANRAKQQSSSAPVKLMQKCCTEPAIDTQYLRLQIKYAHIWINCFIQVLGHLTGI